MLFTVDTIAESDAGVLVGRMFDLNSSVHVLYMLRYSNYTFPPFLWPLEPDEDKECLKLQSHFQEQLEQLGVTFGQGAFQLLDV